MTTFDNTIRFCLDQGFEVMSIQPNGDFFVKGKLVENDIEIYRAMIEWLIASGQYKRAAHTTPEV